MLRVNNKDVKIKLIHVSIINLERIKYINTVSLFLTLNMYHSIFHLPKRRWNSTKDQGDLQDTSAQ